MVLKLRHLFVLSLVSDIFAAKKMLAMLGSMKSMNRTLSSRVLHSYQLQNRSLSAVAPSLDPNRLLSAPEARITTLPSGLRVATELRHGETATVGVWIDGKENIYI